MRQAEDAPGPRVDLARTLVYTYDRLYRLTGAATSSGEQYAYTYDAVGNRLQQIIDGDTTDYLYDAANRLTQVNGQDYTWDDRGNLLSTGVMTNVWDAANRLTAVSGQPSAVSFTYNGAGDRVAQTVDVTTTYFALDIQGLPEVIYTSDGDAYLHLPGVIVAERATGERRYLLGDGLGSIRQAVDEAGTVVAYHEFDPYGVPVHDGGEPYGYTGEWYEAEVGLLHLRARWYAPETGRFISSDPFPGFATRSQSLNGYLYAENRPLLWVDPTGYYPLAPHGGIPAVLDPVMSEILASIRAGWELLPNLRAGGAYDTGQVSFGRHQVDVAVEPQTYSPSRQVNGFGSRANSNTEILYQTVLRVQGMVYLAGWLDNVLAAYGASNRPDPPGNTYDPTGRPAPLPAYLGLHIRNDGYAWYDGAPASTNPIDGSVPATVAYVHLIPTNKGRDPGIDPYTTEGLVANPSAMFVAGAANSASLLANISQWGTSSLRKYQVLVQKWRLWQCHATSLFPERRAVVSTYHLYTNAAGYQINPRYLSVDPSGQLRETPIIYPGYAGATIGPSGPCNSSSTCYNLAPVVGVPSTN